MFRLMRILVVEDEPKTAAYLRNGLTENGFVADISGRGDDGLHAAMTGEYDLIILDVVLPERDGWSVLSQLRAAGRATIESHLDPETRTAPVRVEVANPGQRLRIGMFVQVAIDGRRTGGDALMIPSSAVQRIGERTVVFVPSDDAGKFEVRDVELGDEADGSRVVVTGLRAGERVVSKGGLALKSLLLKG
jgi:CheY-like chemotaxis protein